MGAGAGVELCLAIAIGDKLRVESEVGVGWCSWSGVKWRLARPGRNGGASRGGL